MNNNLSPMVLMYHGILSDPSSNIPTDRETGAELYDVSAKDFRTQMQWLKDKGFTPTIFEVVKQYNPNKPIIITFDDGELNNFQEALPVLRELGWKAYFFIIVKRIGKNGYMNWSELKALIASGMVVGSHGLTHEILTNLLGFTNGRRVEGFKK